MSQSEEGEVSNDSNNSERKKQGKPSKKLPAIRKAPKQKKDKNFASANYRTEKCQFFNKGHCLKGDECTYRHDFIPDTARKICKFYLSGACTKQQCPYSHNTKNYPCRFYHIDRSCQLGNNCRFSHEFISGDFYEEYMKDSKEHILKLFKDNRLGNSSLIEFIKEDLPKKDLAPPPIALPEPITQPLKVVKKDPRLKALKPMVTQNPIKSVLTGRVVPQDPRLKREQKQQQQKTEQQSKHFLKCLNHFFFSYY